MTTKTPPLTLVEAELIAGSPATSWMGRCAQISSLLADAYRGEAVYGHWTGPVADASPFAYASRTGFAQHGWIEMPDGSVVDPTRFAFEMVAPYIYIGESDHYDRGGNVFRMAQLGEPPEAKPDGHGPVTLEVSPEAADLIFAITGWRDLTALSLTQVRWLAHISPTVYGLDLAREVFEAIDATVGRVWVPIDNWRWVMGEDDEG